jgi:type II secretory pathway pseudopilin PulG
MTQISFASRPARVFRQPHGKTSGRRTNGLTLIEMLVSMTITLIMIFAIVGVFGRMGDGVNQARSLIEMAGQMRQANYLLQQDFDGLTVRTLPWARADSGPGYIEYLEGPRVDNYASNPNDPEWALDGVPQENHFDNDDVLMMTVRSKGEPFVAMWDGKLIESHVAEVVWFVHYLDVNENDEQDPNEPMALFRRVFPIAPAISGSKRGGRGFALDQLNLRQNRVGHQHEPTDTSFPHEIYPLDHEDDENFRKPANLSGEHVVLTNVISFDVKVFGPNVDEVDSGGGVYVGPQDASYGGEGAKRKGAYVNLGYGVGDGLFAKKPEELRTGNAVGLTSTTWDTWPFYYERDVDPVNNEALDQDGFDGPNQGTNGLDDDGVNGVDDPGERETAPPYPYPLRGIQVRIRVIEPDTQKIRQSTIVVDFVPG